MINPLCIGTFSTQNYLFFYSFVNFLTYPLPRLVIKVMYRKVMSYSYEMRTVFVLGHNVLHCILLCFCYLWLLFWFLF